MSNSDNTLLPPPPPNVHRLMIPGPFPKEYPQILHGIIQEGEYVDYLKRIEEGLFVSKKIFLALILPFLVFISGIISISLTGFVSLAAIMFAGFVWYGISIFVLTFRHSKKEKEAREKAEEILKEINARYYHRGIKWSFSAIVEKDVLSFKCIDITAFTPGTPNAPPIDGVIVNFTQYDIAPGIVPGTYDGAPQPYHPETPLLSQQNDTYGTNPQVLYPSAPPLSSSSSHYSISGVSGESDISTYPGDPSIIIDVN